MTCVGGGNQRDRGKDVCKDGFKEGRAREVLEGRAKEEEAREECVREGGADGRGTWERKSIRK